MILPLDNGVKDQDYILSFVLQEHREQKVIAFMLTCACVDLHATLLNNLPAAKGLEVKALHGRMKQSQRQATLQAFASQKSGDLFCPSKSTFLPIILNT